MRYNPTVFKLFALLLLVQLTVVSEVMAVDEKYAALPLKGTTNQIAKDSSNNVQDTVYYNLTLRPTQTTWNIKNYVTFKIDEYATVALPDTFKVTITFKVYFSKIVSGSIVQDSSALQTLYVEYNKFRNYQNKAVYTFNGAIQSQVKIFSVTSASSSGTFSTYKNVLMLENEIQVSREYVFDPNVNVVQTVAGILGASNDADSCSSAGEYMVSWGKVTNTDEYDLEWAYIDSTALSNYYLPSTTTYDRKKIFFNNASRVSITSEHYQIPILYDKGGVLFYRVRAVRVKRNGQRIESTWSTDYSSGLGIYGFSGHEPTLNWQASTSYAEEGKRKSVVQYFDGLLKNRQTVTKDNNTCYTIVAETMYDYQGRPVIQVMPAPTLNRLIGYTPHFNRDVNGVDYDKDIFDKETSEGGNNCSSTLPGMGTMSGASLYYSSANTLAYTANHKFIPNADLYPFSETRYTPDNTGRILAQGGVGYDFQVNRVTNSTSHDTKYFYGSADQEELDALFGTEAGNASHYTKNMVRDANGQYSVSYVDMHGRTVATALAGKPATIAYDADRLETLPSYNTKTIVKKLLDTTNNLVSGKSIVSSKALIVTRNGGHRFQYSLLPDTIKINDCNNVEICYDCLYDLEVSITNDCSGTPVIIRRNNVTIDSTCNSSSFAIDTTVSLSEGSYLITKKLTISQAGIDKYNEIFLRRNTCTTLQQFIQQQYDLFMARVECYPSCQSCTDSLGTWESYQARYMLNNNIPAEDSAALREQAWMAYQAQNEICNELCNNTGLHNSIREQMLADMTAPYGQYAETESAADANNIFYTNNGIPGLRFKNLPAGSFYKDETGQPDLIQNDQQQLVPPTDGSITVQNFLDNFKSSWVATLLPLHPEYQRLLKYETYAESHIWDERFGRIATFQQAKDSGFLNPAAFTGMPANATFAPPAVQHRDPFFTMLETGYAARFRDSLLNYVKSYDPDLSVWSLATIMAHCDSTDVSCISSYSTLNSAFSIDTSCRGDLDFAWQYFREMYLNKKSELIFQLINTAYPIPGLLPSYTQHFQSIDVLDPQNGVPTDPGNGADSLDLYIDDACRGYAVQWLQELQPCNLTHEDTLNLFPRLVAVCKKGGDIDHIFGSSTTKPGTSAGGDTSFIQVLKSVLGSRYDSTCNAFLITAPKPYGGQTAYSDVEIWDKPDSCQCNRITTLYQGYQASTDASFADYVYRKTGTRMYPGALDTLRLTCAGLISCSHLANPIALPPALQCNTGNTCVDCATVNSAYYDFKTEFPDIIPTREEVDSTQQTRNRLFERYMNYRFGFAKNTAAYLDFMEQCGGGELKPGPCASLMALVDSFTLNVRKGKVNHQLLTQEGVSYNLAQSIDNGTIHFPDSIRSKPETWYNNYQLTAAYGGSFCTSSGYSAEIKFKLFSTSKTGDIFYTNLGYDVTVQRYTSGGSVGISAVIDGTRYIFDSNPNAVLNWMEFRVKVLPNRYQLYYNNKLVIEKERDPGVAITNRTQFGLGVFGRQVCIDRFKVWDANDVLKYQEEFTALLQQGFIDPSFICPAETSCTEQFTAYFNLQQGTSYTAPQIDSVYMANCGAKPSPCSPTGCTPLNSLIAAYQNQYIHPPTGYVDYDLRTFAGNKTPEAGPKGVFDVNRNLVGTTVDGTIKQIKESYVSIWNSSIVNQAVGTLSLLDNGRFRLVLDSGVNAPCNGILGMRFYKADINSDTLDAVITSLGSYITFGDGQYTIVDSAYNGTSTKTGRYTGRFGRTHYPYYAISHTYTGSSVRTITVYHTDTLGMLGFDNYLIGSARHLPKLSKLRGYAPQHCYVLQFHSTQDSTLNTLDSIYNKNQLHGVLCINLFSGDNGPTPFKEYNFGSLAQFHTLRAFWMDATDGPLSVDSILPDIPVNFPNLDYFSSASGLTYSAATDFSLSKLLFIGFNVNSAALVDSFLNQVARTTERDSGFLKIQPYAQTSISDTSVTALNNKGWKLVISNLPAPGGWNILPADTAYTLDQNYPVTTQFTDFYNQQNGTAYTPNQLNTVLQNTYGFIPNVCTTTITGCSGPAGPYLCGDAYGAFPPVSLPDLSPCADSTLFSVGVGTQLYNAYIDSLKNAFNDRYLSKCLKARYHETFTVTALTSEFHYTLYYYDQAGNLVKTVPPAGVDVSKFAFAALYSDSVKAARAGGTVKVPAHGLNTMYRYNTLNQVVAQKTPDAGISNFWYDRLGRLVMSQNAAQKSNSITELNRLYSYTKYDVLGRIEEVGQIKNTTAIEPVTHDLTRNNNNLGSWFTARDLVRGQITRTVYDVPSPQYTGNEATTIWQRNLRNRVSYTNFTDTATLNTFNSQTAYSYDIHGNVDTLLQDYGHTSGVLNVMNVQSGNANRWKRMVYQYDLISGKVNQVAYQPPRGDTYYPDMMYHRYSYDAENRLTLAEISTDSVIWERDARYEYFRHGPLARTVLGQQLVQGVDYAYTLQGWLKGVNAIALGHANDDMGNDGKSGAANQYVARDAVGFQLDYYKAQSATGIYSYGDYRPINNSYYPFPPSQVAVENNGIYDLKPLYNGNIAGMAVNIKFPGATDVQAVQYYNYWYDQLNRITAMQAYRGFNETSNSWSGMTKTTDYYERIAYDANGNILKYLRNGTSSPNINMDSLSYNYYTGTNRLKYVRDNVTDANYADDIDNQTNTSNYSYDAIGNMTADAKESITLVKWNVYGKITEIQRTATGSNPVTNIQYTYDAAGNRISKRVAKAGTTTSIDYTWYVRDASGNTMAVYNSTGPDTGLSVSYSLTLAEQHMYGSSRLGIINRNTDVTTAFSMPEIVNFIRGNKFFELSNHLGNVLVTVSDKKTGVSSNGTTIDYFTADIVNANDYYPFGMGMPGRKYTAGSGYRYGFNGKENDNEVKGEGNQQDYGMRIYDPRLGRFLSVDPLQKKYPDLTPYQFTGNSPIANVDLDGLERIFYKLLLDSKKGTSTLTYVSTEERAPTLTDAFAIIAGRSAADFHGEKYPKSINVSVYQDGTQNINLSKNFKSFKDLLAWQASGYPVPQPTQEEIKTRELGKTLTEFAVNEAYFNYEMSDGHFDGDVGLNITSLFKTKPKVIEKVNEPAVRVNGGNPQAATANTTATVTVSIPKSRYPESAANIEKSTLENGTPPSGILNRPNASNQRKANLQGIKRVKGKDRDEATPAILTPSGKVRVEAITPSDNRGAGSYMGHQLRNVPDGTKVVINTRE